MLFADIKKKRQNVLSNNSSKSTDGFKLQISSPQASGFGIQPTQIGFMSPANATANVTKMEEYRPISKQAVRQRP